jgi:(p)ppGpp synthase/HD superfamily hydrolase
MTKLDEAIKLASWYHKDQKYADEPYINHLERVCQNVKDCNYGEDYQVVAILHDIIEDTNCTPLEIEKQFGVVIRDAVLSITHKKGDDYYSYIENQVVQNPISKVVKFADIMDNWKNSYINIGYKRLQKKYENAMKVLMINWNKYN